MTEHEGNSETQDGDYDPVIAGRFQLLERVTPPSIVAEQTALTDSGRSEGSDRFGRRSGFLLAVAACFGLLLVGIVALVAVNGNDTSVADSTAGVGEAADTPVVADGESDTTAPLIVDGDSDGVTSTRPPDAAGDDGSTDDHSPGGAGSDDSDVPITTVPDDSADDESDATRSTATESTPSTVADTTGTEATQTGSDSVTVSLRGMVTEVFTDCASRLVLDDAGQVVDGGPVTCDGGSYIIVNGTQVFTASGFTSADLAYDKHPANLKPGQSVSVIAARIGGPDGPLGLACDTCRVRIG